jgi:tetratricopeptide (TPR) repeat protein
VTFTRRLSSSCLTALAALVAACTQQSAPQTEATVEPGEPTFVGSESCAACHEAAYDDWMGSHHQLAMQVADSDTVLGDFSDASFDYFGTLSRFYQRDEQFYVSTIDNDGERQEYRVDFVFGVEPLQQYLVEFPDGRLQTLPFSWDTRPAAEGGQRWFHVYGDNEIAPGDPLFWTGRQQNWNYMCAECHSTNLEMGYDVATDTFATTYSEISVGCESCHGPGSRHVELAQGDKLAGEPGLMVDLNDQRDASWLIDPSTGIAERTPPQADAHLQPEACGRCHSRRGIISEGYGYSKLLTDTHRPASLQQPLYHADGQILDEVYVYGSFLQSRMYQAGVTCTDCHNPHSSRLHAGNNPNDACARCHLPSVFADESHTGHETGDAGCVDCHMASETYMVVDDRRDHSFRIPRPDLTLAHGTPNACQDCHADRDAAWAIAAIDAWTDGAYEPREHFGSAIASAQQGFANAELGAVIRDPETPAIARATAISLLAAPFGGDDLELLQGALRDEDPLVRMHALQQLAMLPAEFRIQSGGAALLSDPVRVVRIEAASTYAGLTDLLPIEQARAFATAAEELRNSYHIIASRPEAHAGLGSFESANGNVELAMRYYRKALEIEPLQSLARGNLADLHRAMGDEGRAETVLLEGLELDPDNAALLHALGLLSARTGRPDEAVAHLRRAAELGGSARYDYVLGIALNSTGARDEAVQVLRTAREKYPTDFDIAWGLATMLRDRGDFAGAFRIADELAGRHPDNPTVAGFRDAMREAQ